MQDEVIVAPTPPNRVPWNKGKLTGAKPPLRPKHVWSIRTKLQIEGRVRDLAMFNLAAIASFRVMRGKLGSAEFDHVISAANALQDLPLDIDDTGGLTMAAIRSRARQLKRQRGLALLVVDYLQLIVGEAAENRVQEVSAITRALKALAKELDVPVLYQYRLIYNLTEAYRALRVRSDSSSFCRHNARARNFITGASCSPHSGNS
jgi:hypothetical protein